LIAARPLSYCHQHHQLYYYLYYHHTYTHSLSLSSRVVDLEYEVQILPIEQQ